MRKIIFILGFFLFFGFANSQIINSVTCTPPLVTISGSTWKCLGVRDTLHVSGPNGTTFLWNDGSTTTSYLTGPIDADSSFNVIATNGGCSDTTYFTVTLKIKPNIIITPPVLTCAGNSVLLKAAASGTGPFYYLWTPDGQTTDSITVNPSGPTTYVVYVSNGCKNAKATTVFPDNPSMSVCCDKSILLGDDTILFATGGSSFFKFQWFPSSSVVCLNTMCDSVKVSPIVTTTYTVVGTDTLGCQLERILTINVEKGSNPPILAATPNPTYTEFTISLQKNFNLLVRDAIGRVVISEQESAGTITFGRELSPGMYFMFIDGKLSGKLIKLKPEKP